MHYSRILLLASPWLIGEVAAVALQSRQSDLAAILSGSHDLWSPQTTILLPNSTAFNNSTLRWTIYKPPSYGAALAPATEKDVVQAVSPPSHASVHLGVIVLIIGR